MGVALGVVVYVVVCVCLVSTVCVVMGVAVCMCVVVAVVGLSAQQVQFLLSFSSLRLIDFTIYTGVTITSGRVEEGCLTEALVCKLALHEGALFSCDCFCGPGAGGLLDGVLDVVIHRHGHPGRSAGDFE